MLRYKLRSSAFILGSEAIPFEPTRQYFPARLFLFLHARVFENDPIFIFTNTWKTDIETLLGFSNFREWKFLNLNRIFFTISLEKEEEEKKHVWYYVNERAISFGKEATVVFI